MSSSQPKLLDVIVCDEVRQESNGKLLVIGMYLDNMGVPVVPFTLPVLSFLCKWRVDRGQLPAGRFRVLSPSRKVVRELATIADDAPAGAGGLLLTTFRLPNFTVTELGTYRLVFSPTGGRSRTLVELEVHHAGTGVPEQGGTDQPSP